MKKKMLIGKKGLKQLMQQLIDAQNMLRKIYDIYLQHTFEYHITLYNTFQILTLIKI